MIIKIIPQWYFNKYVEKLLCNIVHTVKNKKFDVLIFTISSVDDDRHKNISLDNLYCKDRINNLIREHFYFDDDNESFNEDIAREMLEIYEEFINNNIENEKLLIVSCIAGISRSPAVAYGLTLNERILSEFPQYNKYIVSVFNKLRWKSKEDIEYQTKTSF